MTQHDAKLAVNGIRRQLEDIVRASSISLVFPEFVGIISLLEELEHHLNERKPAPPNCRPVTAAELQQLGAASNVVIFNPAA